MILISWLILAGSLTAFLPFAPVEGVADSGWGSAVPVELRLDRNDAWGPQVAVDGAGNAVVTWSQNWKLWANRFDVALGWDTPIVLAERISSLGNVAADAAGNAIAVWTQEDETGRHSSVLTARYHAATGEWTAETVLEDAPGARTPTVAMDPQGNAVIIWIQQDGQFDSVFASHFRASTGVWSLPSAIEFMAGNSRNPSIAISPSGTATAVWIQDLTDSTRVLNIVHASRIELASGMWSPVVALESADWADSRNPRIAVDAAGNALSVWSRSQDRIEGGVANIYVARFSTSSGTWGSATLLDTGGGDAFEPRVAVTTGGNATVVWSQNDPPTVYRPSIFARRYIQVLSSWAPVELLEGGSRYADRADVALDSRGNGVAVWRQIDDVSYSIFGSLFIASTATWSPTFAIERSDGITHDVKVVANDAGAGMVVWSQNEGSRVRIFANHIIRMSLLPLYAGPAEWAFEYRVLDVDIASTVSGVGMAVWTQEDGPRRNVYSSRYLPGRAWEDAVRLDRFIGNAYNPRVALDSVGNSMAVWVQNDGESLSVFASHFSAATEEWDAPRIIDASNTYAPQPHLAMDLAGNAVVVWAQDDDVSPGERIFASRFEAATARWSPPVPISPSEYYYASDPEVAVDAAGNALAVWTSEDEDETIEIVFASSYLVASGQWSPPVAIELLDGSERKPHVAMRPDGFALVVWEHEGDIVSRRYTLPTGTWDSIVTVDSMDGWLDLSEVAMDSEGNAFALWVRQPVGAEASVYASRFAAATASWDSPTPVEESPSMTGSADLAAAPGGDAVAVWTQGDSSAKSVFASRYVKGVGWGRPLTLEASSDPADIPQATMDGAGSAIAVWVQNDYSGHANLFANRYVVGDGSPSLVLTSPTVGVTRNPRVTVSGRTDLGVTLTLDGTPVSVDQKGFFSGTVTLQEGSHTFVVVATNLAGRRSTVTATIHVDSKSPVVTVTSPNEGVVVRDPTILVAGEVDDPTATVYVNGQSVRPGPSGQWSLTVAVLSGSNTLRVTATDSVGNQAEAITRSVTYSPPGARDQVLSLPELSNLNTILSISLSVLVAILVGLLVWVYRSLSQRIRNLAARTSVRPEK